jgi:hypothetical protein
MNLAIFMIMQQIAQLIDEITIGEIGKAARSYVDHLKLISLLLSQT